MAAEFPTLDRPSRLGVARVAAAVVAIAMALTAAPAGASDHVDEPSAATTPQGGAVLVMVDTGGSDTGGSDTGGSRTGGSGTARVAAAGTEAIERVVEQIEGEGGTVSHQLDATGVVAATVDARTAQELAEEPGVIAVVPDERLTPSTLDRSSSVEGSTPLSTYAPHPAIGSTGAAAGWPGAGSGRTVAIVDTGVAAAHPAMAGKVVARRCFSTTSVAQGIESGCAGTGALAGEPCTFSTDCSHGTAVAGVAVGAIVDSATDLGGVAPGAGVAAVQVFGEYTGAECPAGCAIASTSDVLSALDWLVTVADGIDLAAVNLSLGGAPNAPTCTYQTGKASVQALAALGVPVIAAAGNDGVVDAVSWPACLDGAIAVAGTRASTSGWGSPEVRDFNAGTKIAVAAPGVGVPAPRAGTTTWALHNGTSFASPAVAGAAAAWRAARPSGALSTFLPSVTSGTVTDVRTGARFPRLWMPALSSTAPPPPPPKPQPTPQPNRRPLMQFERVTVHGRRVTVVGWALDQDGGKPGVRLTVDGRVAQYLQPRLRRDDVYRFLGSTVDRNSGWDHTLDLAPGTRKVCMQAADPGASNWGSTQCRDVVVK